MRVKLLKVWLGERGNQGEGCIVDLSQAEAETLIAGGAAEKVSDTTQTKKRKKTRRKE